MQLYCDILSGISGDMFLAALIDAGFSFDKLKESLSGLPIDFTIKAKKHCDVITSTQLHISSKDKLRRNLHDIIEILDKSSLKKDIKKRAENLFMELGRVEAQIHGVDIEEIHFHELGAVDTIVDIVGSLIALDGLGVSKMYSSPVLLGRGHVKCEHGLLPVPAPATLELLKDKPVIFSAIPTEITTPTGAVLLSMADFSYPNITIERIGYGKGQKKLESPNVLRIILGKEEVAQNNILVIETNIDDANPEIYPYLLEKLFSSGATDAYITQVIMKKGRPGALLTVMTPAEHKDKILQTIFTETTTFGIRYQSIAREILDREHISMKTKYGEVSVKIGSYNGTVVTVSPEYEDCRKLAIEKKVALLDVYNDARTLATKKYIE